MITGLVPARAGSERIAGKNTRQFNGKPIIGWVLEAMHQSALFDRIIVSTDCQRIASIAAEYDAQVPFLRPAELADNHTGLLPVVRHAIHWLDSNAMQASHLCCVLATAALLQPEYLRQAYTAMLEQQSAFAVSVTRYAFPLQRALRVNGNNRIQAVNAEYRQARSQDLEVYYHDAGQFYWGTAEAFLHQDPLLSNSATAINIPSFLALDIDTTEDWQHAELVHRALRTQAAD